MLTNKSNTQNHCYSRYIVTRVGLKRLDVDEKLLMVGVVVVYPLFCSCILLPEIRLSVFSFLSLGNADEGKKVSQTDPTEIGLQLTTSRLNLGLCTHRSSVLGSAQANKLHRKKT